jgi:RNA-directed DNA polymerase
MVFKTFIKPKLDGVFSPNFYGYRPKRNARKSLSEVFENCWKNSWVIDVIYRETRAHKFVKLYIKR